MTLPAVVPDKVPIAVPTLPGIELFYRNYKEPLQPLESGHGYLGVLVEDHEGRILCAVCGRTFHSLGGHVTTAHGMPVTDYKDEFGLLRGSALTSETTRAKFRDHSRRRYPASVLRTYRKTQKEQVAAANSPAAQRKHRNPEHLNKSGRCFMQVLALARTWYQQNGYWSINKFATENHIDRQLVKRYLGGHIESARLLGASPDRRVATKELTDDQLIAILQALGRITGSTPTSSDLRRYGAPERITYAGRFGSWTTAQIAAGFVPTLHPRVRDKCQHCGGPLADMGWASGARGCRPCWRKHQRDAWRKRKGKGLKYDRESS